MKKKFKKFINLRMVLGLSILVIPYYIGLVEYFITRNETILEITKIYYEIIQSLLRTFIKFVL